MSEFRVEIIDRFDTLEQHFGGLEKKFDAVQATVYRNHENRIRRLEAKFEPA